MKTLFLASLAVISLAGATIATRPARGQAATPAATPTQSPAPAAPAAKSSGTVTFVKQQAEDLVRAPKLVGVIAYGSDDKSIGKVDDVLLDQHGAVKVVVIGTGGLLGIGRKEIGIPYSEVRWVMRDHTREVAPAGGTSPVQTSGKPAVTETVDPKATEAYQGYPDKAVINVTQADLKSAPTFQYAPEPTTLAKSAAPKGETAPPAKDPPAPAKEKP